MEKINPNGSSETIRKAPSFCFEAFYNYGHAHHVARIPESFLEWFIGFFEGDGSFYYREKRIQTRFCNDKSYQETICERLVFSICQRERIIIEHIANTFGFGQVSKFIQNEKTYWRWTLTSKKSIENIAYLLSGNLILLKRQQQFLKCIEIGQKKGMFKPPFDKTKPWSSKICLTNAWLSGFIDAEGCFSVSVHLPVSLKTQIDQLPKMKKHWSQQDYQLFEQISQCQIKLNQKFLLTQPSTDQSVLKTILFLFKGKCFYLFKNKAKKKQTALMLVFNLIVYLHIP
uniref:Putative LAGLIDADG homing endonuclease n=1 Tax=Sykidion marinum TaxID=44573 RepID=A0A1W6EGM0_SYKMA|nr:putative LAGLIDADG homing endonuclease [Pseudoneochloris marina]ARK14542.1 putative LAGLIDADG homing endonuclease [Pseudoneochloris marina]